MRNRVLSIVAILGPFLGMLSVAGGLASGQPSQHRTARSTRFSTVFRNSNITVSQGPVLDVGDNHGVCALAFSPNGRLLAVIDSYYPRTARVDYRHPQITLAVWNVHSLRRVWRTPLKTNTVHLAWSPDGKRLIDGEVTVWDGLSGSLLRRVPRKFPGSDPEVDGPVTFSSDGKLVAVGGAAARVESQQRVYIFNSRTWRLLRVLRGFTWGYITEVAFSDDRSLVAAVTYVGETGDGEIGVWDMKGRRRYWYASDGLGRDYGKEHARWPGIFVRFLPRSHAMVTDAWLLRPSASTYEWKPLPPERYGTGEQALLACGSTPSYLFVIAIAKDNFLEFWGSNSRQPLFRWRIPPQTELFAPFRPQLAASPRGDLIGIVTGDCHVRLLQLLFHRVSHTPTAN